MTNSKRARKAWRRYVVHPMHRMGRRINGWLFPKRKPVSGPQNPPENPRFWG